MTTTTESKLINKGSYGCIYYPALPFKLQQHSKNHNHNRQRDDNEFAKRKIYVSKLQKHNFHSEFEDYIGKKIQKIPSYDEFFVPVLSTNKIDIATIKQSYVTDCDAIRKYFNRSHDNTNTKTKTNTLDEYKMLSKQFINQKMKYINGVYLHRYLLGIFYKHKHTTDDNHKDTDETDETDDSPPSDTDDTDNDKSIINKTLRKDERQIKKYRSEFKHDEIERSYHLMSFVFDLYERLMDSIQLLIQHKIVHYDLKENNILIEKIQQLPYIIDFGLSIDIERLLQHKWTETSHKDAKNKTPQTRTYNTIDSNVLYSLDSSKIFKGNYLWKQHFYVHAPDYFLWPIEVHIMTYLINVNEILTSESLYKICYLYVSNNRAIEYMSSGFKKKMFETSIATFSQFIHQPREQVLNELVKYWDKWDMYAINLIFLRIMYELIFNIDTDTETETDTETDEERYSSHTERSLNEERQHKLDPHYSSNRKIVFKSHYKVKLKQKYNSKKIMNTIQVMLRNIHPDPDKRMTPQETKAFIVSIFYEC